MGGEDSRDWSDSEQQAAPKPRGRPRKSVPQQAAATSEEPAKGVLGKGPGGQRRPLDQDSRQTSEQDTTAPKRPKGAADDEAASAGQDADTEQEHLPAKRRRTPLFSMQDIIAAERGDGTESALATQMSHLQQQQQQQEAGLPPAGTSSRPGSRQQQQQHPASGNDEQDWTALLQQQQYQQQQFQLWQQGQLSGYPSPPEGPAAAAANVDLPGPVSSAGPSPSAAAAPTAPPAAAAGQQPYQQQPPAAPSLQPPPPAVAQAGGSSRGMYGSGYGALDPAAAAATPSADALQQQQQQQHQQYPAPQQQQQQQRLAPPEFNPDLLPKGAQRDMALQRERRVLAESAQAELGPDSLGPDTNVATLVQRILKCGVLTRKTVEYRKRAKGLVPSDYNRGTITSAGLIRCVCHGQDITMSEFEQHSNSQIHRPAEYIFIKSVDMSLKSFANLVLQKPIESNLWYCLACNEGGDLLCCEGCPAAFHTACLGHQNQPVANQEWLCADCLMAGKKPRWSANGPLRRQVPLAGAAAAAGPGGGSSSSMRRSSSSAGGGRNATRGSSSDAGAVGRKGSGTYGAGSGLYGASTAAAAAAAGPAAGYGHHMGVSHPGAAIAHPYYEQEEPYTAAAAAGVGNPYAPMTNPPSGVAGAWNSRSQGSAPAAPAEPQYPGSGFSQPAPGFSHPVDATGFSGYDQGYGSGFSAQASLVTQGLASYGDPSQQGLVGSHMGPGVYGDVAAAKTYGEGTALKPEVDVSGLGQGVSQQQQQSGIDQLLQSLAGGNNELLQMLQKHLQSHPAVGDQQQQQQQQHSDTKLAGAQTPSTASGVEQQQQQQQSSPQFDQQQRQVVVARKSSSTLDPAAAAAAPVAQLPVRTPSSTPQQHQHQQQHQRSDLAALAAAAEAAAAPEPAVAAAATADPYHHHHQQQQQQAPAADSAAAANAAAAAAQLCATALRASEAGASGDVMAQVLELTRHFAQHQQQQQHHDQPAPTSDQSVAAALLQMVAAAVAATSEQQQQHAGQMHSPRVAGSTPGQQAAALAPAAAAAATREETATTNSGIGDGQAAAAAAGPEPMDQDDDSPAAPAAAQQPAGVTATTQQQQQQVVSADERRAAVAAALQAGSSLVSNVLGAHSLGDAQRAVAAAGAQLLQALGGLL